MNKLKPNRKRHQLFRLMARDVGYITSAEETEQEKQQRNACLTCNEPECKNGYCEKMRLIGAYR